MFVFEVWRRDLGVGQVYEVRRLEWRTAAEEGEPELTRSDWCRLAGDLDGARAYVPRGLRQRPEPADAADAGLVLVETWR